MYTFFQKFLHWAMGLIIISLLIVGPFMSELDPPLKWSVYMAHKSFGFIILLLIPVRILARVWHKPKREYNNVSNFHKLMISTSVPVLYLTMFIMAFSGFIMAEAGGHGINFLGIYEIPILVEKSEFLASWAYFMHSNFSVLAISIVLLHILASFYHHFVLKDNTLKSMLFRCRK